MYSTWRYIRNRLWRAVPQSETARPTARMLKQDCECHVVNTASAAGLVSAPLMSAYNASKHAVVALSETLFNDLRLAKAKVGVSVLCPACVPTNIHDSERTRPPELTDPRPSTPS